MALICTKPPLLQPVSLAELKSMLRMDAGDTSQDDVLSGLNAAATSWCETISQRRFVQQSWALYMDFFPGYIDLKLAGQRVSSPFVSGSNAVLVGIRYAVVLPYPPVQSIDAFEYDNANGDATDMMNGSTDPADWGFIQDIASQPARLMPPFGSMWPVARVRANAVRMSYTLGYASPIQVTTDATSADLDTASFTSANVGQPISIPGAGLGGSTLNTIIADVDPSGVASVRDAPQVSITTTGLLVDHGSPQHWELAKSAIKFLVNAWFVQRMPAFDKDQREVVTAILGPVTDRRL